MNTIKGKFSRDMHKFGIEIYKFMEQYNLLRGKYCNVS